jgi:hypothetical protein
MGYKSEHPVTNSTLVSFLGSHSVRITFCILIDVRKLALQITQQVDGTVTQNFIFLNKGILKIIIRLHKRFFL